MNGTFVVGGDAAGMGAASKARRASPDLEVVVSPEQFREERGVDLRPGHEVVDEDGAREAGLDPVSITLSAPTRARYYPRSAELSVTLVADRETGRLPGGSVFGREGVTRSDTVWPALEAGLTVTELQNADLGYQPPSSPVRDPDLAAPKVVRGEIEG